MSEKRPCKFEEIPPGSEEGNPCSPDFDEHFRGIRIAAPEEVVFGPGTEDSRYGGFARVIVAGVCKLERQTLGLRGHWNDAILLVATDGRTKRAYSGTPVPFGSAAEPADPLEAPGAVPSAHSGAVIGRWFNPNIVTDLGLPALEADYDVYAILGPYRSNVVHIKLRRKK